MRTNYLSLGVLIHLDTKSLVYGSVTAKEVARGQQHRNGSRFSEQLQEHAAAFTNVFHRLIRPGALQPSTVSLQN